MWKDRLLPLNTFWLFNDKAEKWESNI